MFELLLFVWGVFVVVRLNGFSRFVEGSVGDDVGDDLKEDDKNWDVESGL